MALFATHSLLMSMKRCALASVDLRSESVYHTNFLKTYVLVYTKSILTDFLSLSRCGFTRIIIKPYTGISISSGQSCVHLYITWWSVAFQIQLGAVSATGSLCKLAHVALIKTLFRIKQEDSGLWYFKQCFFFRKHLLPILRSSLGFHQSSCSILSIKGKDVTICGFRKLR